ncbi:MAG: aminopeptidase [Chloroflexota bacterium]|nr:aminopeptidase [Chloroflexota bacterium]MDE2919288.1 aminopeptidase [Chloroflexota bacterium]
MTVLELGPDAIEPRALDAHEAHMLDAVMGQSLGVQAGERVLVVTDPPRRSLGQLFARGALRATGNVHLLLMAEAPDHGSEPPARVAEAMAEADVCFLPTSKSLSHTHARRNASAAGARVASMPSITYEMAMRTLRVDYADIARTSEALADMLSAAATVRLTAPGGTDLHLDLNGRQGFADTGVFTASGAFGNLPAGEAFVAPLEGRAYGTLVFDAALPVDDPDDAVSSAPMVIEVRDGLARSVTGPGAEDLQAVFDRLGQDARNIAELGIGTNPATRISGNVLECEKVVGTAHVALGNSLHIGGATDVPFHSDGVLNRPTILAGDTPLIEDGRLAV